MHIFLFGILYKEFLNKIFFLIKLENFDYKILSLIISINLFIDFI
ncbi:MAG: hypothetical protein IGBAC_1128 [Ignavibacteriae bacterium]|nr:MAG: hypothetical protein IGBAC_1128 [Ignavibacteriota bacterium]